MRQVFITRTGGPEVLEPREAPDPMPPSGALRIRVKAAGVNFADIMARKGLYPDAPKLPAVVGYEVSGVVDAVGPGTPEDWLGKEVVALTRFGGYADTVVAPAGAGFCEACAFDACGMRRNSGKLSHRLATHGRDGSAGGR